MNVFEQVKPSIEAAAAEFGLDPDILFCVAQIETAYISKYVYGPDTGLSGEKGLFQFMPGTWSDVQAALGVSDPFSPSDAARGAAFYLARSIPAMLSGSGAGIDQPSTLRNLILSYNGGAGNVRRGTVSSGALAYWKKFQRLFLSRKMKKAVPWLLFDVFKRVM